jgi:hypothetical protein
MGEGQKNITTEEDKVQRQRQEKEKDHHRGH